MSTLILRRTLIACGAALLAAGPAMADDAASYPNKPVTIVVGYPAGGSTDLVGRLVANEIEKHLGQTVIVENLGGAGGAIGAQKVANAKPDGYTILTGDTGTLAANPYLYKKLSYSAEKDFAPVGLLVRFPMLLVVNSQLPVNNYAEFVEWAKQQTKGVSYGTPGAGSPHHLAIELLRSQSGLNFVHIPYRGSAPAVQDVVAGQLPFMFVDTAAGIQHVQGGKIRAIAVASPARLPTLPDVPTLDEQGLKGFEAYAWQGIVAPAATPKERVAKLSDALQSALKQADIVAKLEGMALEVTPSTAEEMDAYASAERNKWRRVIEESQITLD